MRRVWVAVTPAHRRQLTGVALLLAVAWATWLSPSPVQAGARFVWDVWMVVCWVYAILWFVRVCRERRKMRWSRRFQEHVEFKTGHPGAHFYPKPAWYWNHLRDRRADAR